MDKIDAEWKSTNPNNKSVDNTCSGDKIFYFVREHKEYHSSRVYVGGWFDAYTFAIMVKQIVWVNNG